MTERSKIAPPRQRLSKIENSHLDPITGWKLRYHESVWRSAYKAAYNEKDLSPAALELVDILNAFIRVCNYSERARSLAYVTLAAHIRGLDEVTVKLWFDAISSEYRIIDAADGKDDFKRKFKEAKNFHFFLDETRAFHESYYLDVPRNVHNLTNSIRMTSATDRDGCPLVFKRSQRDLLYPHYSLFKEMTDRDRLEAVGIMKLHHAWKTTDDGEKQKIKRFVTAYAEEMDSAVAIVKSRYVDSLDHLESLMEAAGTPALMEGAL